MATLAVHTAGARVTVRADAWVVTSGRTEIATRPLHEVDSIAIFGSAELTAEARDVALRRGVDVSYFAPGGRWKGRLVSSENPHAERRLAQFSVVSDPERRRRLAAELVRGKIANQRMVVLRAARERAEATIPAVGAALRVLAEQLDEAGTLDVVRGLEGRAAVLYFRGFAAAITNPEMPFRSRNRRPPMDPVNACLSFGYALLLSRVDSAVRATGLDPALGALHDAGRGKPALALDLMEEFRPLVVDRLVLRLINRRQLRPDDFEAAPEDAVLRDESSEPPQDAVPPEGRPTWLAASGRSVYFREFGELLRGRLHYPARDASFQVIDIIAMQAQHFARVIAGVDPAYLPFTPR